MANFLPFNKLTKERGKYVYEDNKIIYLIIRYLERTIFKISEIMVNLDYITIYLNKFQKKTFMKAYRYIVMSSYIWIRFD